MFAGGVCIVTGEKWLVNAVQAGHKTGLISGVLILTVRRQIPKRQVGVIFFYPLLEVIALIF
jgi:hypothetical protein